MQTYGCFDKTFKNKKAETEDKMPANDIQLKNGRFSKMEDKTSKDMISKTRKKKKDV